MTMEQIPDDQMKKLLERAGVDPKTSDVNRRKWPRFDARGDLQFHRPHEKAVHAGQLVDVSKGGLAFLTTASLAVGETVFVSYEESGAKKDAEATVETIHHHPKDVRFLIGAKVTKAF